MKRELVVILLVLLAILTTNTQAQQIAPATPLAHPFWNRGTVALVALDGAAKGFDAYWTHRALDGEYIHNRCYIDAQGVTECPISWLKNAHEANPLAAPFVKTTAGQVAWFTGTWASDVGIAYLAHRTGHHKLERLALVSGIGVSIYGGAYSAHTVFTF